MKAVIKRDQGMIFTYAPDFLLYNHAAREVLGALSFPATNKGYARGSTIMK